MLSPFDGEKMRRAKLLGQNVKKVQIANIKKVAPWCQSTMRQSSKNAPARVQELAWSASEHRGASDHAIGMVTTSEHADAQSTCQTAHKAPYRKLSSS